VFPAVFIAILARTIRARWQWVVAGVAAVVALAVQAAVGGTWHIALAGLGASALGVWLAPAPGASGADGAGSSAGRGR
jgi:predicted branched-subunit amino acid permease